MIFEDKGRVKGELHNHLTFYLEAVFKAWHKKWTSITAPSCWTEKNQVAGFEAAESSWVSD